MTPGVPVHQPDDQTGEGGSALGPTVYLLHFDRRFWHAGHYLGWSSDLDARLAEHRAGRGARLVQVIVAEGIGFTLARTWPGGRDLERDLKRRKASPRLCPICRGGRGNGVPTSSGERHDLDTENPAPGCDFDLRRVEIPPSGPGRGRVRNGPGDGKAAHPDLPGEPD